VILLFSIFCQWFSRRCLIQCCLGQEKWKMLLMVLFIGMVVGSPIQGYMSDKSSRKKLLLVTISCVILSLLIVFIGQPFCSKEYFPILLIVASVINGVFGNVFPVAAVAYSEVIEDNQKALQLTLRKKRQEEGERRGQDTSIERKPNYLLVG